jgi:nucleotide-binding universal stress UspA family protein
MKAMRVLCCLDGQNIEQISDAVFSFLSMKDLTLGLLYVVDSGPQADMERQRGRLFRSHELAGPRLEQMRQAEQEAAQAILAEGERSLNGAEVLRRAGRPEREIVNCAAAWRADLLVICPRSPQDRNLELGPKSVGHVARFVLDHAPCPVLLVRSLTRGQFPIDPKPPKPPER